MNVSANTTVAVLTGDLVRSSKMSVEKLETVRAETQAATKDIANWRQGLCPQALDFFRGDAWQFLLTEPSLALRAAVFLRARLIAKGADSAVVMGLGSVDSLSEERISLSSGSAFIRSGHALDRLGSGRRMAVSSREHPSPNEPDWPNVTLELVEALLERLTARQAQLLAMALHPQRRTHETIARMLEPPVERQVVSKTLSRAGYAAIEAAVMAFEQAYHR